MELAWYLLLGLTFAAYLVLAGYDYGVGILLARPASDAGRAGRPQRARPVLPRQRGVAGRRGGPALRRVPGAGGGAAVRPLPGGRRRRWSARCSPSRGGPAAQPVRTPAGPRPLGPPDHDRRRAGAGRLGRRARRAAAGRASRDGVAHASPPFTAACALALVALVAVHGAAFLALRLPAEPARRHAALVDPPGAGGTRRGGRGHRRGPALFPGTGNSPAAARPARAGAAGRRAAAGPRGRRAGDAAAGRSPRRPPSLALPVLLVGAATYPYALSWTTGGGLAVADAAAAPETLRLLGPVVLTLLPVLLAVQVTVLVGVPRPGRPRRAHVLLVWLTHGRCDRLIRACCAACPRRGRTWSSWRCSAC